MYNTQITRRNKGAIVILLDRSGSMAEEVTFEGKVVTKSVALAECVNALLEEIINRSHRERYVGDYFDVAIIGYAGEKAESLIGSGFRHITDIDTMDVPTRIVHRTRTLPNGERFDTLTERREWVSPAAKGRTPMGDALRMARRMVTSWCRKHPESFPPIVINITDGEATDATPEDIATLATRLRQAGTNDGNVLFVNIHLSDHSNPSSEAIRFPSESEPIPVNRHATLLYNISSTLPALYNADIQAIRGGTPPFRAICYNASVSELVGLLAIGSLPINQMI